MEDILAKIMKDASPTKHSAVKQSCLESQGLLNCSYIFALNIFSEYYFI